MKHDTAASPKRAPAWLTIMIVSALAVAFAGVFWLLGSAVASNHPSSVVVQPSPTAVAGTTLQPHPAPPFTLTDQNGQAVSLQSLRGHVVVLTFMDATCQQECPIEMGYLNQTTQFLGAQKTAQIDWVAISVNPSNTPAQASAFLATHQATMQMHFLLGSQAQLAPLWKAYGIQAIPQGNDIAHTSGLYVIDQQGREREWVDMPFDARQLSIDLVHVLGS